MHAHERVTSGPSIRGCSTSSPLLNTPSSMNHHSSTSPSRVKLPLRLGCQCSQGHRIESAPCSTDLGASSPPMSLLQGTAAAAQGLKQGHDTNAAAHVLLALVSHPSHCNCQPPAQVQDNNKNAHRTTQNDSRAPAPAGCDSGHPYASVLQVRPPRCRQQLHTPVQQRLGDRVGGRHRPRVAGRQLSLRAVGEERHSC